MDHREEEQFKAIAMGNLAENPEWEELCHMSAMYSIKVFAMLKRYGIESIEHVTFACDGGVPVLRIEMQEHMRDHLR